MPNLNVPMYQFDFKSNTSNLCQIVFPNLDDWNFTFAAYLFVPKQCSLDHVFSTLETVNPSFLMISMDENDPRQEPNAKFHISGSEGNVPWVWTILGKEQEDIDSWINIYYTDEIGEKE